MTLKVALAQMAPVFLDREATLEKMLGSMDRAATAGAGLVVFGEALLPGYPFWPERTGGAVFEDDVQKDLFAHYAGQAVDIGAGHLDPLCAKAREHGLAEMRVEQQATGDDGFGLGVRGQFQDTSSNAEAAKEE